MTLKSPWSSRWGTLAVLTTARPKQKDLAQEFGAILGTITRPSSRQTSKGLQPVKLLFALKENIFISFASDGGR